MSTDSAPTAKPGGSGTVAGITLADVIQLKGYNKFTGCISVEHGQAQGAIYFRDGEVVHAEQGANSGEAAFYLIVRWPGAKFNVQPKVGSPLQTIQQSVSFLLLEANRRKEEAINAPDEEPPSSPPAGTEPQRPLTLAERLAQIAGVAYGVLLDSNGVPVDDQSPEAATLAERALGIVTLARDLGDSFGIGEMSSAAFHDWDQQLLLFESKRYYLAVSVHTENNLVQVETDIRKALSAKK